MHSGIRLQHGLQLVLCAALIGCSGKKAVSPDEAVLPEQAGEGHQISGKWWDQQPLKLTESSSDQVAADFSSDGRSLIYQNNSDGNWEIYTLDLESLKSRRITDTPEVEEDPSFSPDGQFILCTVHPNSISENVPRDILLMSVEGKERRRISQHGSDDWAPQFSADGSRILFLSDRVDERGDVSDYERRVALYEYSLESGETTQLTEGARISSPMSTANGLAICRDFLQVEWVENRSGVEALPAASENWQIGHLAWSSTAGWFASGMPELGNSRLLHWDRQSWIELPQNELEEIQGPVSSPDGSRLAFHGRSGGQWDLYFWPVKD